jgi:hypothetical protein
MSSFRAVDFDNQLRNYLHSALRHAEPCAAVWERIEFELDIVLNPASSPSRTDSLTARLGQRISDIGRMLFLVPDWYNHLDERRLDVMAQISTYPGAHVFTASVV